MTGSGPKKRLPASERKKVILEAALRTFVEYGYHGAIMDTIAERANVTKPILYRHFPSKLDLLLAIVEEAGDSLSNSLAEPVAGEMNWLDMIRHSVGSYLRFVRDNEMGFRIIYASDVNVANEVSDSINGIRERRIEEATQVIESYTDTDEYPLTDIRTVAVMIIGLIESTAKHWMEHKDRPLQDYEDMLAWAVASILSKLPPVKR